MACDRLNVMQFAAVFNIGGTERHVINLAGGIDRRRFDLSFGCLRRVGEFLEDLEAQQIPVVEYPVNTLYGPGSVTRRIQLARDLRRNRVQVVNAYGFWANVFAVPAAWIAGVPAIVASIRDIGTHLTPLQRYVHRVACSMADRVAVNAAAVRDTLIAEGYDPGRIHVIKNGIPINGAGRANGSTLRREFGLAPNTRIVAVVSRLSPLKGIEYFLLAAAEISRRFDDVVFAVIGDYGMGPSAQREALESLTGRLGLGARTIFTGFRRDVGELLSEVSISVLPSLSEGLSNSLLESMAAGIPVVATRVGGNPEVIEDGVNGLLVPPGDAPPLARAMSILLERPELAARIGAEGKRTIRSSFSLERMVRETENLYLSLLEEKNRWKRVAKGRKALRSF